MTLLTTHIRHRTRCLVIRYASHLLKVRCISDSTGNSIKANLLDKRLPVLYDSFSSDRSKLLARSLDDFIPSYPTPSTRSQGNDIELLQPGHHLIYFPQLVSTAALLSDGTDNIHSPGEPWTHRLWAGGRVQFFQTDGLQLDGRARVLVERIQDVRIIGPENEEKVFVKIERRVGRGVQGLPRSRKHERIARSTPSDSLNACVIETRDICFMRPNKPGVSLFQPRRPVAPPEGADYSHTLIPTPALLFRFSALTFNAHAIHIDPAYTRDVYGLPGLLVHGPLSLLLMLEFVRWKLGIEKARRQGSSTLDVPLVITEINYRNLVPLFVDEAMTICCKRSGIIRTGMKGGQTACTNEDWDVWIQKDEGDKASLAVRGTVKVEGAVKSEALA